MNEEECKKRIQENIKEKKGRLREKMGTMKIHVGRKLNVNENELIER